MQIAKGSLGFFESRGSEDAVKVLTDPATTKYLSSIELGKDGDATSLENMKASLKYIRECNELRAKEGKAPLKVSDVLMAQAQADVDWSDDNFNHAKQFNVGENLAWFYDDPFDGWYTAEKKSYDEQKAEGVEHPKDTGHYTNIVDSGYDVSGFALSGTYSDNVYENTVTYGQTFNTSAWEGGVGLHGIITIGTMYTVDEYEKAFDAYYDGLVNADQAYKDAQAKVEAAKAALDKADTASEQARTALDAASKAAERSKADRTQAETKLADATAKAQDAQTKLADATAARDTADQGARSAKTTLDAAKSDATAAKTAEQSAADRLTEAQSALDKAQAAYDKAVDAQQTASDHVLALTDAKMALDKALEQAKADQRAAKAAKAKADGAAAKLAEADAAVQKTAADVASKAKTLADVQASYDAAKSEYETAEKALADAKANAADTDAVQTAEATLAAAKAKLDVASKAVKAAQSKLADAKARLADLERQTGQDAGDTTDGDAKSDGTVQSGTSDTTTVTVSTPATADVANKAAVRTNGAAKLGATGVDTAEVTVFAVVLAAAAGATMQLRRRGRGRFDVMARHAR